MDVTFVLEESGVTATVEVPCEANATAAKKVACTALAVPPASVEMRIGTQVVEGTCRLQDTAFVAGVQVVLARCCADIKCPAEHTPTGSLDIEVAFFSLSSCGGLCLLIQKALWTREGYVTGLDTETFSPAFKFKVDIESYGAPAISRCKTRCYLAYDEGIQEIALPGGEVLRKVDGTSYPAVLACGGVVVSWCEDGVSVYDEDLTLLCSLSQARCSQVAVSHCGGWVMTSSRGDPGEPDVRLWDVNTGEAVACVDVAGERAGALSLAASVFAVAVSGVHPNEVRLYDWSAEALGSFAKPGHFYIRSMQFTLCEKYLVVEFMYTAESEQFSLYQYDVATMSCVRVFSDVAVYTSFAISPCSRVLFFSKSGQDTVVTRHLYPY